MHHLDGLIGLAGIYLMVALMLFYAWQGQPVGLFACIVIGLGLAAKRGGGTPTRP